MECAAVKGLRLKYPGEKALQFKDFDFSVRNGEKVLLLGPSGCGKSTLLMVLAGLIPHSLEVPMKAEQIHIPKRWGYVFQDPDTQFCMPYVDEELAFVLENLSVPREQMDGIIRQTLRQVGLHLKDVHLPISSLSQGMKQRLAIACALAMQPEALFLDEPTALLDPEGTRQVWETIKAVCREKTVIIVEHKVDQVLEFADRLVLFDGSGKIVADGPPLDIVTQKKSLLDEYGVWYPGIWAEAERKVFAAGVPAFGQSSGTKETGEKGEKEALMVLNRFKGYRPGAEEPKIEVERAYVFPGDWIAVVGENGAGKSSLLLALMRLLPTEGEYLLAGRPAGETKELARVLAFVFQNPEHQFVTDTVIGELSYSLKMNGEEGDTESAEALLLQYGLLEHRHKHPFQLSVGQKRRLSVATAVVGTPLAILLDEPTFGQDAVNTFAILKRLEEWRSRGTAILMVTHDPDIVRRFATKVWLIEEGKWRGEVSPEEYAKMETTGEKTGCR